MSALAGFWLAGVCAVLDDQGLLSAAFPGTRGYRAFAARRRNLLVRCGADTDDAAPNSAAKLAAAACYYYRTRLERTGVLEVVS